MIKREFPIKSRMRREELDEIANQALIDIEKGQAFRVPKEVLRRLEIAELVWITKENFSYSVDLIRITECGRKKLEKFRGEAK